MAALDGLTATIRRGEFVALLGPSGCGKSTALNCIAGLLSLSAGSIWLDELRIDELPPEKRGFGMVFQNYALFPHMSVRKNVGFGLRMRGAAGADIDNRVARALKMVQLTGHEEKLPGQLSGGQQQRVAIARAIVVEPPLVLMDEPLSNLDARLRLEMRAEIRRIHRSLGRATIYVTHDQEEALSMADRIVVMREGRVRQIGVPPEIYAEPADLEVARFMGYRNELAATVEHEAGNEVMLSGGLRGRAMARLMTGARVRAAIRPETRPVQRGQDLCGQRLRRAWNCPSTLKTPIPARPRNGTTTRRAPGGIWSADLSLGDGPLAGRVENVEYGGRESLIDVVLPDGTRLHVRSAAPARLGDEVRVGFAPQRLLVYPAE